MTTRSRIKTEHAGAKNGGGYYGRRAEAKTESGIRRRHDDRVAVEEELESIRDDSWTDGTDGRRGAREASRGDAA